MAEDLATAEAWMGSGRTPRTGFGYDVHRLAPDGDVERVGHRIGDQVIDHLRQPLGRIADVVDLRDAAFLRRHRAADRDQGV